MYIVIILFNFSTASIFTIVKDTIHWICLYLYSSSPIVVAANTSEVSLSLPIIDDDIPELDESITVSIVNVSGGALLGVNTNVIVTILTNDDAYGLLGFAEVCIHLITYVQLSLLFFPFYLTILYHFSNLLIFVNFLSFSFPYSFSL